MNNFKHLSGQAAELYVAARLGQQGYNVLWPMMAQSRYDLVIEKDGEFTRLQVKKATLSKAGPYSYLQARISSRNKGSKPLYVKGEFDLFAFTDMDKIWLAPFEELQEHTSVCLLSTNPNYKPQTKYSAEGWLLCPETTH
jgi:hypothetical protein